MSLINEITRIFFPVTCGLCGEKINERYTCRKCLNIIEYYHKRVAISINDESYCDKIISILPYKGIFKSRMLCYKFEGAKYIGITFAEMISIIIKNENIEANAIVAVPISKARLKERGYNQSAIIAKNISKITKIPYKENVIIKTKNNLRQSELTLHERKINVKNAYSIKDIESIKNKKIILIDDIYTTGATLNECARILKKYGATKVIALTVMYSELE